MSILDKAVCPKCGKDTAIIKLSENSDGESYRCHDCHIRWVDNHYTGQLFVFADTDEERSRRFEVPKTTRQTEKAKKPQAAPNRREPRTPPPAPRPTILPDPPAPHIRREPPRTPPPVPRPSISPASPAPSTRREPPRTPPPVPRPTAPPLQTARIAQLRAKQQVDGRITRQEESTAIQKFCEDRKIKWLFHFTRAENLSAILSRGLLTRSDLERLPIRERPTFNDSRRYDEQKDTVSVSISYPNYRMFYTYRQKTAEPWVVLVLQSRILWELNCVFCSTNAANVSVSSTPWPFRMSADSLFAMFGDLPGIRRDVLRIPAYFTTDPQAEVLVKGGIERRYIESVWFETRDQLSAWYGSKPNTIGITIAAGEGWFNRRMDYKHWQRDNHDGR